jgi:hypothetical protein
VKTHSTYRDEIYGVGSEDVSLQISTSLLVSNNEIWLPVTIAVEVQGHDKGAPFVSHRDGHLEDISIAAPAEHL